MPYFEDELLGTIDETHFQESTPNPEVFFLDRELYLFEVHDLYADGTFYLIKNCEAYSQIYTISVLFQNNNETFSYPILFFLCVTNLLPLMLT